jgi:hypothetical protein
MVKQTCTLTLRDGRTVTAVVEAASPEGDYPIHYSGAVEALPRRHETGTPADLELFFRNLARELGGSLRNETEGTYDRWAE